MISKFSYEYDCRIAFALSLMLYILTLTANAAENQSYTELVNWIKADAPDTSSLTTGERLTINDREQYLDGLIPVSAWSYYIFDDMDMEFAERGSYPPAPDWGVRMDRDYSIDERGVLLDFTGGGFPFPDINEDDPFAGQKVI